MLHPIFFGLVLVVIVLSKQNATTLQQAIESWFLSWLIGHRTLSPQTVASYRDAFKLLIRWFSEYKELKPDLITFDNLGRTEILEFASWLKTERDCSPKTVNCRIGAVRSFASFVACEYPERSAWASSIISIKRVKESKPTFDYLTPIEVQALVNACNTLTPEGRRDAMMIKLLFNTGFRVSELIELRKSSFKFNENGCYVTVIGKGRKKRTVPIWKETADTVRKYIEELRLNDDQHLFSGRNVEHLSRSGARSRLNAVVRRAEASCPSLKNKKVGLHTLRHSTAMAMLTAGVDLSTIAMWLGHENVQTTHKYMIADMELKKKALEKAMEKNPFGLTKRPLLFEPDEKLLAFLESL
jgi:integrase/recombinase XerD